MQQQVRHGIRVNLIIFYHAAAKKQTTFSGKLFTDWDKPNLVKLACVGFNIVNLSRFSQLTQLSLK
jgi:hypothetical protein